MKRLKVALAVIIVLIATVLVAQKVLALNLNWGANGACDPGSASVTHFPYELFCSGNPYDYGDESTYGTWVTGDTVPAGSDTQPTKLLEGKYNYLDFTVTYVADHKARTMPATAPGAGSDNPGILFWNTVNINDDLFSSFTDLSGGASTGDCPGSNGTAEVRNFEDIQPDGSNGLNASPYAYTGSSGYENCGSQGKRISWTRGGGAGTVTRRFRINLKKIANRSFCVRANVSVSYGDAKQWPTLTGEENNTAAHLAKQSNPHTGCYTFYNHTVDGYLTILDCRNYKIDFAHDNDHIGQGAFYRILRTSDNLQWANGATNTSGNAGPLSVPLASFNVGETYKLQVLDPDDGPFGTWTDVPAAHGVRTVPPGCAPLPTPPTFSLSADCNIIFLAGLNDDNMGSAGVHFWGVVYQRHADGSRGPAAGFIDGRGAGDTPYDYTAIEDGENQGWVIDVGAYDVLPDGSDGAFGYVQSVSVGQCYTATCKSVTVTGVNAVPGTTNGVKAGSTFSISATFHNNQPAGTTDYLPSSLSDGSNNFNLGATIWGQPQWGNRSTAYGSDVPLQQDFTVTINNLNAPAGIGNTPLTVYADYFGLFAIDTSACSVNIATYKHFTLEPAATLYWDSQDPTVLDYSGSITEKNPPDPHIQYTQGGVTYDGVPAKVDRSLYKFGVAPNIDTKPTDVGRFNNKTYPRSGPFANPYLPVNGGEKYCAETDIYPGTGWLGPSDDIKQPGTVPPGLDCEIVDNKPFFKTTGAGVSAGGDFTGGGCTGGGTLASWNNDSGTNPNFDFGAGTALHAIALGKIVGFASAQTDPTRPPDNLSFGNVDATLAGVRTSGPYSPTEGGGYGATHCIGTVAAPITGATPIATPTFTVPASVPYNPSLGRNLESFSRTGDLDLTGTSIANGQSISIFATGNVYINSNITYAGSGSGAGSWGSKNDIPSFIIHAGGNIYIKPSVTELDGYYVSQKSGGSIYTCGNSNFTPVAKDLLWGCNNQLKVVGTFVADHVALMRTFGSLRNEKPTSAVLSSGFAWNCGGSTCNKVNDPNPPNSLSKRCISMDNPNEPPGNTWGDNYLCVDRSSSTQLWWQPNQSPDSMNKAQTASGLPHCTKFFPGDTHFNHSWLCSSADIHFSTSAGSDYPGYTCTPIYEPADSDNGGFWNNMPYQPALCEPAASAGGAPSSLSCSNAGIVMDANTCAAEVFSFSPEMYMAKPAIDLPNHGAPLWQAITSLPPVL